MRNACERHIQITAATLLAGLLLFSASAMSKECEFGLRETDTTMVTLEKAVKIVNGLVGDPELQIGIPSRDPPDGSFVPVYAVRPSEAKGMVAHVREGCRAILIGSQEFEQSFSKFAEGNVLIEGQETEMLSLLLLHELGHIRYKHYGAFLPSDQAPSLNLDATASKIREDEADAFTAKILRDEIEAMSTGEAYIPGVMVITFVSSLSFVISSQASLDCFGCRVLGSPDIFWDHSQSHENLEYRLLKLNHAIAPSKTSLQLLEDYEKQRSESSRGSLRIMTPDGGSRLLDADSEEFKVFEKLIGDLKDAQRSE